MKEHDLKPGDVLLFRPEGYGLLAPLVRRLITWGHVAMYFTETRYGLPLIIESIGRGVLIRSLFSYTGKTVRVMRPKENCGAGDRAAKAAREVADRPASWYGYWDIPRYVLPKLILARLSKFLPKNWKFVLWLMTHTYRHNSVYICSELVATAYQAAGCPLVDEKTIPLPDDLADSPALLVVGEIEIRGSDILSRERG